MGDSVLVLDFGTTNFKAAIVDAGGQMSSVHRVPSPIVHPAPGRSEIDPKQFEQTISTAIAALGASQGLSDVGAISYSSQANTFVLLDVSDKPLTPFVVWTDERAASLADEFTKWVDDPSFSAATGLPVYGHLFSPAKMMWFAREHPQVWSKMRRVCLLGDYFARWATGQHTTDGGVAGLSGIFDVARWEWSPALCAKAGIPITALPKVARSATSVGTIRPEFAEAHGLPRSCQFVAGILDQYAGAIGVGNASPGGCSETTGTVLATVRCADHFSGPMDSRVFRGPSADAGTFYHMTFGSVSANLLQFLQGALPDRPSFESLDSAANVSQTRLKLDPALSPEAMMQQIRQWIGHEDVGDIVGCIYQTVADALAAQVNTLFTDEPGPDSIRCAGGAAKSRKWLQLKANRLQRTMIAPFCDEPTLLGAASLASRATNTPISPQKRIPLENQLIRPQK